MNKEFIPYEQALELKELGFDEPCMFPYHRNNTEYIDSAHIELANYNATEKLVSAPLYQQAFRWFREKYGWYQTIDTYFDENNVLKEHGWHIYQDGNDRTENYLRMLDSSQKQQVEDTYEEAELACLKKLIEIVKNERK